MQLKHKKILVTGGTSGLGRAMALRFGQEGADVAITGRRKQALADVATQMRELCGRDLVIIQADHLHESDNERAIAESVRALGGLNALINNAGVIGFDGVLEPRP